ncbi:phage protein NinX family protein [Pseudomonas japonica]|uniref:phage protein NinX family protein n=1 Tax=Pseudomonas japonica TaxID=256466 RepID=UPI0015E41641|nr:phage protein NinX family protein [Pseudomonas japonica]MBA1243421.1 DUF2591 family protein [Pseudomonas japonica]MBA1290529.1 DUF2591 family protein [Pseudomonas japonica]
MTTQVRTGDLIGGALDWAVAKAVGVPVRLEPPCYGLPWRPYRNDLDRSRYNPSVNWAIGGALIDQHCKVFGLHRGHAEWRAFAYRPYLDARLQRLAGGPTVLIAFCRALVLVHLGDMINIPAELSPA